MAQDTSRKGQIVGGEYRVGELFASDRTVTLHRAMSTVTGDEVVVAFVASGGARFDRNAPRGRDLAPIVDAGDDAGGGQFVVMEAGAIEDARRYALFGRDSAAVSNRAIAAVPDLDVPAPSAISRRGLSDPAGAVSSRRPAISSNPPRKPESKSGAAYGMLDFEGDSDAAGAEPIVLASEPRSQRGQFGRELAMGPGGPVSVRTRERAAARTVDEDVSTVSVGEAARGLARALAAGVLVAGGAFALLKFVRVKIDWNVLHIAPSAINGSSVKFSAITALVAVALCFLVGILAVYARPRAWGLLVSAFGLLAVAIAMIIVTLTTTPAGVLGPVPDGAFIVPWAMPFVAFGFALRATASAWRRFDDDARGIAIGVGWCIGASIAIFITAHLLQVVGVFAMLGLSATWL